MTAPQSQTTPEQNKQIMVRWFEEVWNKGRRETIHELFPEHAVLHDGLNTFSGPDDFCRFYDWFRTQFTDFHATPILALAEGNLACLHWSIALRHIGTGKRAEVTGTSVLRFLNGQFIEGWQNWDAARLATEVPEFSAALLQWQQSPRTRSASST
jgi:predicted SnoaL-like aldol condensation-catalyzing enzyme